MKVWSPEIMEIFTHRNEGKPWGSHGIYQLRPFGSEPFQAKITCIGHKFQRRRLRDVSKMANSKLEMYKNCQSFVGFLEDFQRFRLDGLFRIDDRKGATKKASESCQWFPGSSLHVLTDQM